MTEGLLLLHAFPLDASMWEAQIRAFTSEVPAVAPNFPGFAGAPLYGDVVHMYAAADLAFDAVKSAGLQRVVVCGLSMGGYVALAYWRRHRHGVLGMLLANTRAGADDDAGKDRRRALADRLEAEGNEFLADSPPPLLSEGAPPDLWERVKGIIRAQPAPAIAAASRGMAERPDSTGDLTTIDVPTVVVTSTGDTLIPPEASTPMADHIPEARLEIIAGAGHLSNLEAPDEFNRILREHLVRCGVLAR